MGWTFVWMMLVLKIPIAGLLWIVWWAIHQTDDPVPVRNEDDGGNDRPHRPRTPRPGPVRRGPHGEPAPAAPARTRRRTRVRARETQDG